MPSHSTSTVLLVAREPSTEQEIRSLLEQAGLVVLSIATLDEALAALDRAAVVVLAGSPFDPVLAEYCQQLRQRASSPAPPLLLLTDQPAPQTDLDAILLRPFSAEQLVAQLRLLVRLHRAELANQKDHDGTSQGPDEQEWQMAMQALRDSQALYLSLVESLPIAIYRKDLQGRFTFVNRFLCRTLHRRIEDLLDREESDFDLEDLALEYTRDSAGVMTSGLTYEGVIEEIAPEGDSRFIQIVQAPLRDAAGHITGMQGIFWDVSDRENAERRLARQVADLEVARRIHQQLFPSPTASVIRQAWRHGYDLAGISYPVEQIGGDYFDYFSLPGDRLAVAVGDVSGHGIGSALLMAITRSYLHASAKGDGHPGAVLAQVNQLLANDIEGDRFITLILVWLDLRKRTLTYASAGHTSAYILDEHGTLKQELPSTGIPLGIHAVAEFEPTRPIQLAGGDMVLLLTDGVVEARDPDKQIFTHQRAIEMVRLYRQASAREVVNNLFHGVRAFSHNAPQLDDITAVVIKDGGSMN